MKRERRTFSGIAIDFRQNGDFLETSVNDVHNLYDFSRRSDGFKRFIAFLLMISAPARAKTLKNVLVINDDPDIGLHPSGARHVRDELIRMSEANYVVYSTHSIFMIDRERIERHVIVSKTNEITTASVATESNVVDEEVLYNALGFSAFEMLKERNVVFEGWRDKELFRVAIGKLPADFKSQKDEIVSIGLCHAQGVKDIRRIVPLLELAGRQCTIVTDSDQAAREHQADHRKRKMYGEWLRYDEILPDFAAMTSEDFIAADVVTKVASAATKHVEVPSSMGNFESSGSPGVLKEIDTWCAKARVSPDDRKTILERVKEEVFSNLKPSHVRSEYYDFLRLLLERIKRTGKEASSN